eukprot:657892-Rhodomonas_salina.1
MQEEEEVEEGGRREEGNIMTFERSQSVAQQQQSTPQPTWQVPPIDLGPTSKPPHKTLSHPGSQARSQSATSSGESRSA